MTRGPRAHRARIALAAAGLALAGGFVLAVLRAGRPPEGPLPIALDRSPCARCRMLVSDLRFAAQLQTTDGEVLVFDDPGCLLLYRHEHGTAHEHAAYVHDYASERWLALDAAVFVPAGPTPMGYGLAARPADAARGLDWPAALEAVRARERARIRPGAPVPPPTRAQAREPAPDPPPGAADAPRP